MADKNSQIKPNRQSTETKEIEALQTQKRLWRKISNKTRIQLEICVGYGLPVDFAGKTIGMSSRNSNRVMHEQARRRIKESMQQGQLTGLRLQDIQQKQVCSLESELEFSEA